MNDEQNIQDEGLNNEKLINYVQGNLPPSDNHELESSMINSDFVNDAVEGLQTVADKSKLDNYVNDLNKNLFKQLKTKKHRKEKRKIKYVGWALVAAGIILIACIIAYVVLRFFWKI